MVQEKIKQYVHKILEQQGQLKEDKETLENLFNGFNEFDTIGISTDMGEIQMQNRETKKSYELLTVISLNDNPTLDLSVAQPSKYKVEDTSFGRGIMCYKTNALNILKGTINSHEKIVKIMVESNSILNLCGTKSKDYLRKVYSTITDKESIKTDADFLDYVCNKGNHKIEIITGMIVLGKPIYKGSLICDYMDIGFLIKSSQIITKALEVK